MKYFLLENKKTGWSGSVSERIYYDRLQNHPDEFFDPRYGEGFIPGKEEPLALAPETAPEPNADKPAKPAGLSGWDIEPKEDSKGWFFVVRYGENGQKIFAQEKALRRAAAESLKEKLNKAL